MMETSATDMLLPPEYTVITENHELSSEILKIYYNRHWPFIQIIDRGFSSYDQQKVSTKLPQGWQIHNYSNKALAASVIHNHEDPCFNPNFSSDYTQHQVATAIAKMIIEYTWELPEIVSSTSSIATFVWLELKKHSLELQNYIASPREQQLFSKSHHLALSI